MKLDKDEEGRSLHRPGVYAITHVESSRSYIGSTKNISKRWTRHRVSLRAGKNASLELQAAWNQFGGSAFDFRVLEEVGDTTALLEREQFWMDRYRADGIPLFNISPLAASTAGMKQRDDVRAKAATDPSRHFRGKLKEQDVKAIKTKLAAGHRQMALADEYGVHPHTIYMIASGRVYADVHAAASESVLA